MKIERIKMTRSTFLDEEQLIANAIEVLLDKLGPIETSRFLSLPRKKRIESVKRHQLWQGRIKKDEYFDKLFKE